MDHNEDQLKFKRYVNCPDCKGDGHIITNEYFRGIRQTRFEPCRRCNEKGSVDLVIEANKEIRTSKFVGTGLFLLLMLLMIFRAYLHVNGDEFGTIIVTVVVFLDAIGLFWSLINIERAQVIKRRGEQTEEEICDLYDEHHFTDENTEEDENPQDLLGLLQNSSQ